MLQDPRNINLDIIRQRSVEIRQAISLLERHANLPREEFLADQTIIDASKYHLLIAIEAAISICTHLSARLAQRSPETYAQCFEILASTGVITEELAERLGRMARFRNLLVHVYGEVDNNRVLEVIQSNLRDLDTYLSAIGQAVRERFS